MSNRRPGPQGVHPYKHPKKPKPPLYSMQGCGCTIGDDASLAPVPQCEPAPSTLPYNKVVEAKNPKNVRVHAEAPNREYAISLAKVIAEREGVALGPLKVAKQSKFCGAQGQPIWAVIFNVATGSSGMGYQGHPYGTYSEEFGEGESCQAPPKVVALNTVHKTKKSNIFRILVATNDESTAVAMARQIADQEGIVPAADPKARKSKYCEAGVPIWGVLVMTVPPGGEARAATMGNVPTAQSVQPPVQKFTPAINEMERMTGTGDEEEIRSFASQRLLTPSMWQPGTHSAHYAAPPSHSFGYRRGMQGHPHGRYSDDVDFGGSAKLGNVSKIILPPQEGGSWRVKSFRMGAYEGYPFIHTFVPVKGGSLAAKKTFAESWARGVAKSQQFVPTQPVAVEEVRVMAMLPMGLTPVPYVYKGNTIIRVDLYVTQESFDLVVARKEAKSGKSGTDVSRPSGGSSATPRGRRRNMTYRPMPQEVVDAPPAARPGGPRPGQQTEPPPPPPAEETPTPEEVPTDAVDPATGLQMTPLQWYYFMQGWWFDEASGGWIDLWAQSGYQPQDQQQGQQQGVYVEPEWQQTYQDQGYVQQGDSNYWTQQVPQDDYYQEWAQQGWQAWETPTALYYEQEGYWPTVSGYWPNVVDMGYYDANPSR